MTTITDITITSAADQADRAAESPDPGPLAGTGGEGRQDSRPAFTDRPMIPVALLTAHPGNVREYRQADQAFCQSEIRRATGLKAAEVRAGITAGGLSAGTRELTGTGGYEWTLEDLALIAPFEDDPDTMNRIMQALGYSQPLNYIIQKLHDEQQARARRSELTAGLEAKGVTVLNHAPDGATSLHMLCADPAPAPDPDSGQSGDIAADGRGAGTEDGEASDAEAEAMDPAAHASCPGAVAVLRPWQQEPSWYCLDPGKHGHASRHQSVLPPARSGGDPGTGSPEDSAEPDPGRKLVIEGNKAWNAAAKTSGTAG